MVHRTSLLTSKETGILRDGRFTSSFMRQCALSAAVSDRFCGRANAYSLAAFSGAQTRKWENRCLVILGCHCAAASIWLHHSAHCVMSTRRLAEIGALIRSLKFALRRAPPPSDRSVFQCRCTTF